MTELRAAIIGCGWSGSRFNEGRRRSASLLAHAAAYHRLRGVRVACVADRDPSRLSRCQKAWGVPSGYTDYLEMLRNEALDVVSICTPDASHHEIALQVLDVPGVRGILCEKPLATTLRDAREIVRLGGERNVKVGVNYIRRYVQGYQEVARLLREESLGRLQAVHGYYSGGLVHNGTHLLDVLTWFLGRPSEVQAWCRGDTRSDECVEAVLQFPGGVSAVIQGISVERFPLFEIDILGTEGRVTISRDGELIRRYGVRQGRGFDRRVLARNVAVINTRLQDPTLAAIRDLLSVLGSAKEPKCCGRDGVTAVGVAEAIIESGRSEKPVCVEIADV